MELPTLYARTNTGAIQEWTVEIEDGSYRTIHGQVGGKLQTTEWTVCVTTNEGRANERLPDMQAIFEARAMWQKKLDSGYHEDVSNIDNFTFVEPMLAKKWEDRKDKVKFPLYCQPKLDGLRAVISKDGAFTRQGKKWVSIPHILQALDSIFDRYPDLILDGELYNHDLHDDFNKITSLVKKTKPKDKDLVESAKIVQFHWYDTASDKYTFSQRRNWMVELYNRFDLPDCIQLVPTHKVVDLESLDKYYGHFIENGWEGQMVRENLPYEFKRSSTLLKRKEFQDKEYRVEAIIEGTGNRSGMAGSMVFTNELGHTFNANIKGTREYLKYIWEHQEEFIGKMATVRFFNLTPVKLIPRFPYVYGFSSDRN